MYIHVDLGFGPGPCTRGCVVGPGVPRSFGFAGGDGHADDSGFARGFGFTRVPLAVLATSTLAWGALYGHAVECITAMIAAVLVDVIAGFLHSRRRV